MDTLHKQNAYTHTVNVRVRLFKHEEIYKTLSYFKIVCINF